jgi:hypothetical protein
MGTVSKNFRMVKATRMKIPREVKAHRVARAGKTTERISSMIQPATQRAIVVHALRKLLNSTNGLTGGFSEHFLHSASGRDIEKCSSFSKTGTPKASAEEPQFTQDFV